METNAHKTIVDILKSEKVLDKKGDWLNLNKLWAKPDTRRLFTTQLINVLQEEAVFTDDPVIIHPEGVASSYGILPIVSLLVDKLELRLAIWREIGDIVTTTSMIFPDISSFSHNLNCIIIQDVIGKGTTLRKMFQTLSDLEWHVTSYIAIVQIEKFQAELENNIHICKDITSPNFKFIGIIKSSEIGVK